METVLEHGSPFPEGPRPRPRWGAKVRLFGQYLVDEGVISADDLGEALGLMRTLNTTLGELAVERGLVSRREADEIHRLQRCIDGRWGEIALTLGIGSLTAAALDDLRWEQEDQNLRLTDALVQLGFLTPTEVEQHLSDFEAEQPDLTTSGLPPTWEGSAAYAVLDVTPRVFSRILSTPARVGPARIWDGADHDVSATAQLVTPHERLQLGLSIAHCAAETIATRLQGSREESTPQGVVSTLVTIITDHVQRRLESVDAGVHSVLPPFPARLPDQGLAFDLALSEGRGLLVMHRCAIADHC